jgi:hypothetical protein
MKTLSFLIICLSLGLMSCSNPPQSIPDSNDGQDTRTER